MASLDLPGAMLSDSLVVDSSRGSPRGGLMAWIVCLSAGLFFFYEFFQLNLFDVINQSLRDDFNIQATQLSWMSSTYLWADLLFLLPAGLLLDRFSTRLVILISMLGCIVGTVGFGLTHSFGWATFFRFLSGIGNAFCFLACVVLVARWFPLRRQALVIGCVITMAFIGGMMAHTPLAYLNERYGWRNALLIDGGLGVVLFFWLLFFIKDRPKESVQNNLHQQTPTTHFLQAILGPQNWLSGLYTSCLNLPIMVLGALWGASYLKVVHHVSQIAASNIVSLIFVGSIIGCPVVGWLSDRASSRKPLMIIGAVASFLIVMPLLLGSMFSEIKLGLLFFLLGFVTSTQVITYPLITESNHPNNTGVATGIASVIIMGGAAIGQILFGWMMEFHAQGLAQQYSAVDFQYALWMFPIAIIIALIAIILTPEKRSLYASG